MRFYLFYNVIGNVSQGETLYFKDGGEANRVYTSIKDQSDINYIELGKEIEKDGLPVCEVFANQSNNDIEPSEIARNREASQHKIVINKVERY